MEKKHFSLEMRDDNMVTKVFKIILGVACIAIACYWLIYNIKSVKLDGRLWITVVFLVGFGGYLIWTALGYGYRYIEFTGDMIRLKKNSFLSPIDIKAPNVELIEIYPLKFTVHLKSAKTILTRFGVSDIEKIELIKDEIMKFAAGHNIPNELRNELE
jgi:hypothetical protein